jgi:dihydroneopterin aldolase
MEANDRDQSSDAFATTVDVELRGLSVYTHHGVTEAEREIGQRLEIDITIALSGCDAVLTDRIEDTVDYSAVTDIVILAATERSYRTLERVATVIAERLMESFDCDSVRVRAAKPEPPLPVAIGEAAVEVSRHRVADEEEEEAE